MGVCYYIFVTGKLPFYAVVPIELFNLIAQASPALPGNLNEHSKRIINGLLCVDVKKRLTVQDLESDLWLLKSAQSPKRQARLNAFSPVKQKVSVLFHGVKKSLLTAFAHFLCIFCIPGIFCKFCIFCIFCILCIFCIFCCQL